ncbi:ABC transporter ATP-binding protein [Vibrio lentus]|nr:ABC transporter ATP-binding protein [Vibrio lentus]
MTLKWLPPEQRNIGMIFQDYALFPHLTVNQNVAFSLRDMSEQDRNARKLKRCLSLFILTNLAIVNTINYLVDNSSIAIARSLAYKPDLLLLDEPFSNIDTQVRHELISQIRKIFKKQGVTAIFVTHSREEAFAFADKMAVMRIMVSSNNTARRQIVLPHPSSKFVCRFLGRR